MKIQIITNIRKAQLLMQKGHECKKAYLSPRTGAIVFNFERTEQFIQDWHDIQANCKSKN